METTGRQPASATEAEEKQQKWDGQTEVNLLDKMGGAIKAKRVAIVMHNNPDPDCIAAAFGLRLLLKRHFKVQSDLFYGGIIGRAENRCMVSQLKIPVKDIKEMDLRVYRGTALVDTQPGAGNNSLPGNTLPDIVIDHHRPLRKKTRSVPFYDVRPEAGSSSTIVTRYLRAAQVRVPRRVATSLFYGIKTDTFDLGREAGPADVEAYRFLLNKVDRSTLNRIEHPIHNRSYYLHLHRALESVEIYDDVCVTVLMGVDYPEITAELAEWFFHMWGIHWVLALGVQEDRKIYISVRTRNKRKKAGTILSRVVGSHGMGGGHWQVAGGLIELEKPDRAAVENEVQRLKNRFLKAVKKEVPDKPVQLIQAPSANCKPDDG